MNPCQANRREEFAVKEFAGKGGYNRQEICVRAGMNQSYDVHSSDITTGRAALYTDKKLNTFDTNDVREDFRITVCCHKNKHLLIDIISDTCKKFFDLGFKHDNSGGFIFAAYFHTALEEYLYVVDANDCNKPAEASCIMLFTASKDSRELVAAYNLIFDGMRCCYEDESR